MHFPLFLDAADRFHSFYSATNDESDGKRREANMGVPDSLAQDLKAGQQREQS